MFLVQDFLVDSHPGGHEERHSEECDSLGDGKIVKAISDFLFNQVPRTYPVPTRRAPKTSSPLVRQSNPDSLCFSGIDNLRLAHFKPVKSPKFISTTSLPDTMVHVTMPSVIISTDRYLDRS